MAIPKNVIISNSASSALNEFLTGNEFDKIAILVDENSRLHCLPKLKVEKDFNVIEIVSGETNKTLRTCEKVWDEMTHLKMSRNSLLINLGGGVITDMGGFIASTYKRGIHFCNIPTTLLSQVDASIGGKVGIDFNGYKNHIGVFQEPDQVILDTDFLSTLDQRQKKSGFAEIIKHGLIADYDYWTQISDQSFEDTTQWSTLLERSVHLKGEVVSEDPFEKGKRKILNFGHTLGHAMETYFLNTDTPLLHGEAIAIGMILEGKLSEIKTGLSRKELFALSGYIAGSYEYINLPRLEEIMPLMLQDKKNEGGSINFSLLKSIGDCTWNISVSQGDISDAFDFYSGLYK